MASNVPHKAVLFLRAEIHPLLPSGECSGTPCVEVETFILAISGGSRNEAERKLNEALEALKKTCT